MRLKNKMEQNEKLRMALKEIQAILKSQDKIDKEQIHEIYIIIYHALNN